MKRMWSKAINVFFALVFLYASGHLVYIWYDSYENKQTLLEAKDIYSDTHLLQEEANSEGKNAFDELRAINQDIVGWVSINDTEIHYPVLQSSDNDYYLNRNYKGERTRAGSIFMDYRNHPEEAKHTILYGHHMRDGTMFNELERFTDEAFFYESDGHFFDTPVGQYTIDVFSVYYTTTDFYYIETDFEDDEAYGEFLREIQARSMYSSATEVSSSDRIITFSTCDDSTGQDGRFVVHAKLVPQAA
ncbi:MULTISPECIES: class B sortase [Shouchella]|uniref:Class B sortase n=1 Tax=Shouchella hunanensis TaxID=766894 RepID=A0ABY7W719_9BACI|nr:MULTISPECIES: class B sortase [Shouchella]WDF04747.1 class B sortase [Shouchella hunanensis]GAF22041.1 NPQTN specific sortase B [Bacillus sp. JCM 19047]